MSRWRQRCFFTQFVWTAVLLGLTVLTGGTLAGGPPLVYQLDTNLGAWSPIPIADDSAVLVGGAARAGSGNISDTATYFTIHARVFDFGDQTGGSAEISVADVASEVGSVAASPPGDWSKPLLGSPEAPTRTLAIKPFVVGQMSRSAQGSFQIPFTEEFQPLTPAIISRPAQNGFPAGFEVPEDLRVEWRVTLTVKNTLDREITGIEVNEHLNTELDVDPTSISVTPGLQGTVPLNQPYSTYAAVRQGNLKISWTVTQLGPGEEARLSFVAYSRVMNGQQQYSEPTPEPSPTYLNSSATLVYYYCGNKQDVNLTPIPVWVKEGGFLRVSLTGTQYDWQIRKPGVYAAAPVEIGVYSNRPVAVAFSDFGNLSAVSPGDGGTIPTFYGFGNTLAEIDQGGWIPAAALNSRQLETETTQIGHTAIWKVWPKLDVSGARAGEYQDVAILTFTLVETTSFVDQ